MGRYRSICLSQAQLGGPSKGLTFSSNWVSIRVSHEAAELGIPGRVKGKGKWAVPGLPEVQGGWGLE